MAKVGHLVNGQFVTIAQDFDIANAPVCTETESGLMSPDDKKKIDAAYTKDDIASATTIENLFN